ncbi:MAG: O-antigen ligase family protein [Bacteroidetes bacterium]|nr:O-antigen ligase family protein [Bacteroidota bacterium]MBL0065309.1 O-antigen ligase family protein [Bacteroidota bacterium]MBL0138304.1 O-antigen ligase family protein [Bacteroidota bacterium]
MEKTNSLQKLFNILILILLIKIAGYFTVSENVAITRILKIIFRTGMTLAIFGVYTSLKSKGWLASWSWSNSIIPLFYGAYLVLGFISFFWSTDIGYSALQLLMNLESFLFAYYFIAVFLLIRKHQPESAIRLSYLLGNAVFFILLIFVVGVIVAPDIFYRLTHGGEEARLGGYLMNPNELGMLAVIGASMVALELRENRSKFLLIFMMSIALVALVLTGSRSSMIGFVLILLYFTLRSENKKLKAGVLIAMAVAMPFVLSTIIIKQGNVDEVLSMTGRLPFWKALLTEGLPNEPLFGYGYMRIAYKDYFQSVHTYAGQMTHNTFIQVLMNLGIVGFLLVILQLGITIRFFLRSKDIEKKSFFVALFIPILINSFTEFGIFGETNYGILFYQLLIFYGVLQYNENLSRRERVIMNTGKKIGFSEKFAG